MYGIFFHFALISFCGNGNDDGQMDGCRDGEMEGRRGCSNMELEGLERMKLFCVIFADFKSHHNNKAGNMCGHSFIS